MAFVLTRGPSPVLKSFVLHAISRSKSTTSRHRSAPLDAASLPRTEIAAEIETFGRPHYPKSLSSAAEGGIFSRVSQVRFSRVAFCQIFICSASGTLAMIIGSHRDAAEIETF